MTLGAYHGGVLPPKVQASVETIRADTRSGAAELAIRAAECLMAAAGERPILVEAARALVRAQPAMASIFTVANAALQAEDPVEACRDFIENLRRGLDRAARLAAGLIRDGAVVLTHSRSSTVIAAFDAARGAGRRFEVIATESRPGGEGQTMTAELASLGIAVKLIADAEMRAAMSGAALALTGADAVAAAGVVNKVGTALVALAARDRGLPIYAAATTDKFVPADYRGIVAGAVFETTPLDWFTGIVTEEGALAIKDVSAWLATLSTHGALRG